jgi:hypothetical protein
VSAFVLLNLEIFDPIKGSLKHCFHYCLGQQCNNDHLAGQGAASREG